MRRSALIGAASHPLHNYFSKRPSAFDSSDALSSLSRIRDCSLRNFCYNEVNQLLEEPPKMNEKKHIDYSQKIAEMYYVKKDTARLNGITDDFNL